MNLRLRYLHEVASDQAQVDFWEVIADNLIDDRLALTRLGDAVGATPVSLHCVGFDLGGVDPLESTYVKAIARLVETLRPVRVSDHLCWQRLDGEHFADLLPLPYSDKLIDHVADRINRVQDALGRQLSVENLSYYVQFAGSTLTEVDVLNALVRRTGCGLLVDLANIEVNEANLGIQADAFLASIDLDAVTELHLAGPEQVGDGLVDTHGGTPSMRQLRWAGELRHVPACYERDTNLPSTLREAARPLERLRAARSSSPR